MIAVRTRTTTTQRTKVSLRESKVSGSSLTATD